MWSEDDRRTIDKAMGLAPPERAATSLRDAAEAVVGAFPPDPNPPTERGKVLEALRAALLTPVAPEVPPRRDGLREALERLAPEDPWEHVEITTESWQPDDECGWCRRVKPRLKKDRGFDAHEADCAWVAARVALAATSEPPDSGDAAALERGRMALALRTLNLSDAQVAAIRAGTGDWAANVRPSRDAGIDAALLARAYNRSIEDGEAMDFGLASKVAAEYARLRAAAPVEAREENPRG